MKRENCLPQVLEFVAAEHPSVFFLLNKEGGILWASKAATKIYGYTAEEFHEMKFAGLTAGGAAAYTRTPGGAVYEYHRRKDGRVMPMAIKSCPLDAESGSYILIVVQEILDQELANQSGEINREKRQLFPSCDAALWKRYEAIAAGIIVYDQSSRIVFANRKMERILNCSWLDMKGKFLSGSTWKFMDDKGKGISFDTFASSQSLASGRSVNNKILGLKRNPADSVQWLLVNSTPLFAPQTRLISEVIVTVLDITPMRNAAEVLRENEQRLIFALESIHAGEWEFNLQDLSVRYSSRSAEIFLGEERSGSFSSPWNEVVNCFLEEDRETINLSVRAAMERREPFDVTGRILRPDGAERWIQATGRPHELDGRVTTLSGIVIDITEKKQAEILQRQVLLYSHEIVVKEIVESFGLHYFVLDQNMRYVTFNTLHADFMEQLFGAEIAAGHCFLEYVNVDAKKSLMERNLHRALAGEVFSFEHYLTLEGQGFKCLAAIYCPIRNENGQILGVSFFAYDASKPKSAQTLLQASENRYRKLVEDSNLIFLQLNEQGEIQYLNRFGCEFFEYGLAELIGKSFAAALVPSVASSRCDLNKLLPFVLRRRFSGIRRRTCELMTRSKKRVWLEWSYHWAIEPNQSGAILVAAGMDVTREMQVRMEERRGFQRRRRQEILNGAISGKLTAEEFAKLARTNRIPLAYPLLCLLLCPGSLDLNGVSAWLAEKSRRQMNSLVDWLQDFGAGMVWQTADGICLIMPCPEDCSSERDAWMRQKTNEIVQHVMLYAPEIGWQCGASLAAGPAVTLAEVYFQARAALTFGPSLLSTHTIYYWRDLGSYQLLVRDVQTESTGWFITEQLGPLLQLGNAEVQRELLNTLRELGSFDSEEKIARRLHIHRMTVRYRKAALAKLLGCDLNEGKVVMNLAIAVMLWELRKKCL